MEFDATITGTKQGMYVACVDEERAGYDCDELCPSCPHPCRILLEKEGRNLEKGRRVRVEENLAIIDTPSKLIPILAGALIVFSIAAHIIKILLVTDYSGIFSSLLSGIIATILIYLILKSKKEKKEGALRTGRILRVYSQRGGSFGG